MSIKLSLTLAAALADMREGHRVLIVAANRDAVAHMVGVARGKLLDGERLRRSAGSEEITSTAGGWIRFACYTSATHGAGRGLTLDRIHLDHSALWDELAPTLSTAALGATITHH
ncbi:hypothetical protein [Nocardia niigatensis]